jgi:hypothetical protein
MSLAMWFGCRHTKRQVSGAVSFADFFKNLGLLSVFFMVAVLVGTV